MLNKDILILFQGLQELSVEIFPAKIAFVIARNLKVLTPIVEDIEIARFSIGRKYGVSAEAGYYIPEDKQEAANKELQDLGNIEVDVPIIKIKISDIENISLSAATAAAIIPMIEEEE